MLSSFAMVRQVIGIPVGLGFLLQPTATAHVSAAADVADVTAARHRAWKLMYKQLPEKVYDDNMHVLIYDACHKQLTQGSNHNRCAVIISTKWISCATLSFANFGCTYCQLHVCTD